MGRERHAIRDLSKRVAAWGMKQPDPVLGRSLYREACAVPTIGTELSLHPLLLEHKVLGHLTSLRGLDLELDRLELNLVYGAAGVLGTLSLRVNDLRSRLSRPARVAASWS